MKSVLLFIREEANDYGRLYIIGLFVVMLDQVSKLWILYNITPGAYIDPPPISIIDPFFYIVHIYNTGSAWGQLPGKSQFLALLAVIALICIFIFRKRLELKDWSMQWTFGLLCGGIVGNLIDRLIYGHVIDFLDFHFFGYRFPAFNIADSGITVGVILYVFFVLFAKKKTFDQY